VNYTASQNIVGGEVTFTNSSGSVVGPLSTRNITRVDSTTQVVEWRCSQAQLPAELAPGQYTLTITVRDEYGNQSQHTATVTVYDQTQGAQLVPNTQLVSSTARFDPRRGEAVTLAFNLTTAAEVQLLVIDGAGRQIHREVMSVSSGYHTLSWNGKDMNGNDAPMGISIMMVVAKGEYDKAPRLLGKKPVITGF